MRDGHRYLFIVENKTKKETFIESVGNKESTILSSNGYIKKVKNGGGEYKYKESTKEFLIALKNSISKYDKIFLAMDNDEKGEKIAWDIIEFLEKNSLNAENIYRITPQSLDKNSILKAIEHARSIDKNKINAFIARMAVEKIIQNDISKILRWILQKNGSILELENVSIDDISIGRITAPALALIAKAQEKIDTFIPKRYKKVAIDYFYENINFTVKSKARFNEENEDKLNKFVESIRANKHIVLSYKKRTKDKLPPPPLNSIWLQRSASYLFLMTPSDVLKTAKKLYEGVLINGDKIGLITYYKTKSTYIDDENIFKIINLVKKLYGNEYAVETKRIYNDNTGKNPEERAIIPTHLTLDFYPEKLQRYLSQEEHIIYEYIFMRALATQMSTSVYDQSELVISIGKNRFYTMSNSLIFDGWERIGSVWSTAEDEGDYIQEESLLPENLLPNEELSPIDIRSYGFNEKAPWRYGEGRFITTLEKLGIGRFTTISEITEFLKRKKFISSEKSMLYPTMLGRVFYYCMEEYAPWLLDIDKAVKFENDIELVLEGKKAKEDIVLEYEELKRELIIKTGYTQGDTLEEWMINKAKYIIKELGVEPEEDIWDNKKSLLSFIKKNENLRRSLGSCPECKSGSVYSNEYGFKCNDSRCSFFISYKNIENFLSAYDRTIPKKILTKYIETILKNGAVIVEDLYDLEQDMFFNAYMGIKYYKDKNMWNMVFTNSKNEQNNNLYRPKLTEDEINKMDKHKIALENRKLKEELEKEREERRLMMDESKKDALTRAYNRGCFDEDLKKLFNSSDKKKLSCAFIDGDKFKSINDTYGHQAGDKVLQFLVNQMFNGIKNIRRARVYRYGGEEFIILFAEMARKDVLSIINNIRKSIEAKEVEYKNEKIKFTISAGVSFVATDDTVETFLNRADKAVYLAKSNGRNRIEIGE